MIVINQHLVSCQGKGLQILWQTNYPNWPC